jgi:hypothetical protein
MQHLYNSVVKVTRLHTVASHGIPSYNYTEVKAALKCRLDIGFLRQGKDQPMAAEAGRAPDRVGVMYCDVTEPLKPGDRVTAVTGPILGTFEIKVIPDIAIGYSAGHHIEVQVVEVAQQLAGQYDFS